MSKKIDWSRPIEASDGRKAFVISDDARLDIEGERVVVIAMAQHGSRLHDTTTPLYRTYDTNEHRPVGRTIGRAVNFQNVPDIQTVYLRYNIDGDTSSHARSPEGSSVVSVRLTFTDGIATGVFLDRPNRDKVRDKVKTRG